MNKLEQKPDGTYYCSECQFIFGENFVDDLGDEFDGWHTAWHEIVIESEKPNGIDNLPAGFLDIAQGE